MSARDWIDEERDRREQGRTRALSQGAHAAVNARYPGCTREHCCECGEETGKAGRGEDSIYTEDGRGPFCESCDPERQEAP